MNQKDPARQLRSLRTCHKLIEPNSPTRFRDPHAFVPELSERLEKDPNLCDGARRCLRLLAAYTYRRDRETRRAEITVTYLARAMNRCRRTVQRYLRQLERAGYIRTTVIASARSRMCVGLIVALLKPLFAKHHTQQWPLQLRKSGATGLSQKQRHRYKTMPISLEQWTLRCSDGVFRSWLKTFPPLPISL